MLTYLLVLRVITVMFFVVSVRTIFVEKKSLIVILLGSVSMFRSFLARCKCRCAFVFVLTFQSYFFVSCSGRLRFLFYLHASTSWLRKAVLFKRTNVALLPLRYHLYLL